MHRVASRDGCVPVRACVGCVWRLRMESDKNGFVYGGGGVIDGAGWCQ